MRTLSSTLLDAQRGPSSIPYVKVKAFDRVAGVDRLNWSRLYSGNEADFYHDATMPGDGSLVRARVALSGSYYYLYRQRVVDPGPGSDFGSWTGPGPQVSDSSGTALCSHGAMVLLFYAHPDRKRLYVMESNDYGASFGSPTEISVAPVQVDWMAADISDAGVVALFFAGAGSAYVIKRTGTTWGTTTAWTNSLSTITGLDCVYQGDWNLIISGKEPGDNYKVWSTVYGDGHSQTSGFWAPLEEITMASEGSDMEFHCPYLDLPDLYRVVFVEKYTGSEAYARPYWSYTVPESTFISNLWREPVPFNLSSNYGLAIVHDEAHVWLTRPDGTWRAPLTTPSVELTDEVIGVVAQIRPFSGQVSVTLRNDDGRFNTLGSGTYEAIKKGSELQISFGFKTPNGNEASQGPAYWIEGWEYTMGGGESQLILYAQDGFSLLDRFWARRQFTWAKGDKTILEILKFLFARVGLKLATISSSSAISQLPASTTHPGDSGLTVVRRLLEMVPDVILLVEDTAYLKNPQASDGADYVYETN